MSTMTARRTTSPSRRRLTTPLTATSCSSRPAPTPATAIATSISWARPSPSAARDGPETCTIDAGGGWYIRDPNGNLEHHRGFHFHSGEDANSVLQGFSITNGFITYYQSGGGILCDNSSPRIANCIVIGNYARYGGGMAVINSAVHVVDCVISYNVADEHGGGIYCDSNTKEIAIFERNLIVSNSAQVHIRFGGDGGGVFLAADAHLINCTLSGNWAGYHGGGLYCWLYDHEVQMTNCIVWGNRCGEPSGSQLVLYKFGEGRSRRGELFASLGISHCTVGGDVDECVVDPCDGIEGNWVETPPLFVQAGYWDASGTPYELEDDFWIAGDYHLKSQAGRWDPIIASWVYDDVTSPCIDAGDPNSPVGDEPLPNGGIVNLGAYGGTAEASKSHFD